MEFVQDYIMRIIHELVRLALKLIFNITIQESKQQIEENQEVNEKYDELINMVREGNINQAENLLSEIDFYDDKTNLLLGIQFYDYLNNMDNEFLEQHEFSRQEVKEGLEALLIKYGYKDITSLL